MRVPPSPKRRAGHELGRLGTAGAGAAAQVAQRAHEGDGMRDTVARVIVAATLILAAALSHGAEIVSGVLR